MMEGERLMVQHLRQLRIIPLMLIEHQYAVEDEDDGDDKCEVDGTRPLLILYDCETTGLSIYSEHITDIAAKVVDPPVQLGAPTFSSLVRTGRRISAIGN